MEVFRKQVDQVLESTLKIEELLTVAVPALYGELDAATDPTALLAAFFKIVIQDLAADLKSNKPLRIQIMILLLLEMERVACPTESESVPRQEAVEEWFDTLLIATLSKPQVILGQFLPLIMLYYQESLTSLVQELKWKAGYQQPSPVKEAVKTKRARRPESVLADQSAFTTSGDSDVSKVDNRRQKRRNVLDRLKNRQVEVIKPKLVAKPRFESRVSIDDFITASKIARQDEPVLILETPVKKRMSMLSSPLCASPLASAAPSKFGNSPMRKKSLNFFA